MRERGGGEEREKEIVMDGYMLMNNKKIIKIKKRKGEPNDSPEILNRSATSDIPGPSFWEQTHTVKNTSMSQRGNKAALNSES